MTQRKAADQAPPYTLKDKGMIHSSFVIDETGKILQAACKIRPQDTVSRAREAIEAEISVPPVGT